MTDLRILIYGTCHVGDATARELVKLWARCVDTLNPDCDVVLIDAPSPYGAEKIFPQWAWQLESGEVKRPRTGDIPSRDGVHVDNSRHVWSFTENAGHLNKNGVDGAGRAFMQGMLLAMEGGYDYCVHVEGDLVMTRAIRPWIERMHKHGITCAAPFDSYYQFGEWGLSFFNVAWLEETQFVERYDWRSQKGIPIPELVFEKLAGDAFFTLPIRGARNDFHQINRQNVVHAFPYGIDYLTHCYKDFEIYRLLMQRNGVPLP